ncbi:MAG TPA: XrtA system polysaccharide deacetylase [Gemmatimonadales bacterium]|nr:XrtA system polysaccharide deacetylase [Gemmatimonadales bacterium]
MALGSATATAHFFTVDVEEHFQVSVFDRVVDRADWERLPSRVEANVDVLLELLDRHGTVGTFFTLGWIADRKPALVRRIAAAGHEIASHGWWHRRVSTLTAAEFREEVRRSKQTLEDVAGQAVVGFRAPSFSIVPGVEWAFDVLLEEGYRYDSSLFPIRRPDYGYPAAITVPHQLERAAGPLLELPMATTVLAGLRVPAAGGGYLRQFPYRLIARAFREHAAVGLPAMFYIHPWEVDPNQPRLSVPALTRWRHYGGLARTLPRLERLLREFRFTSVARHFAIPDGPTALDAWTRIAV